MGLGGREGRRESRKRRVSSGNDWVRISWSPGLGIRSPGAGFTSCQTWVLCKSSQYSQYLSHLCSLLVPGFNNITKPTTEPFTFSLRSHLMSLHCNASSQHSINTYQVMNKNKRESPQSIIHESVLLDKSQSQSSQIKE